MIEAAIGAAANVGTTIGSLIGARKDKLAAENSALKSWQRNYEAQKEFAQNSIQWRVQDAKNAGINPYAVVGGQTAGYTPQDTSYQTNYQQGISQAMNGLSEAMGQLNLASVAEEVKGKQLDNDKKALELANKTAKAALAQVPATFTQPYQKVTGGQLMTTASGHQMVVPDAEASLDDFSGMAQGVETLFNLDAAERLREANKGKGDIGLTALGYRYAPPGSRELERPNVEAAKIARDYGTLTGLFTLPSLWFKNGLGVLERAFRRKGR